MAVFLPAGVFVAAAGAAEHPCLDAKNMVEETQCLSAELDKANNVLANYPDAAKQRIGEENNGKPQLDTAQEAWLRYRSVQCGDVYTYWEAGLVATGLIWNAKLN